MFRCSKCCVFLATAFALLSVSYAFAQDADDAHEENWQIVEDLDATFAEGCRNTEFVFKTRNSGDVSDTLDQARKTEFREDAISCDEGLLAFDGSKEMARLKWVPRKIIFHEATNSVQDGPSDVVCAGDFVAAFTPLYQLTETRASVAELHFFGEKIFFQNLCWAFLNPLEVGCYHDATFLPWLKPGWKKGERFDVEVQADKEEGFVTLITHDETMNAIRKLTLSNRGKFPVIVKRELEVKLPDGTSYVWDDIVTESKMVENNLVVPVSIHSCGGPEGSVYRVKQWQGTLIENPDAAVFEIPIDKDTRISLANEEKKAAVLQRIAENEGRLDLEKVATIVTGDPNVQGDGNHVPFSAGIDGEDRKSSSSRRSETKGNGLPIFYWFTAAIVLLSLISLVIVVRLRQSQRSRNE